MKWLPSKGEQHKCFRGYSASKHLLNSTSQITKLIIYFIGTGMFLSGDVSRFKAKTFASVSPQGLSQEIQEIQEIQDIAADISVKVLGEDLLGSGFIVKQRDQNYVVITNQHVLRAGAAPYSIQTSDGQTYRAEIVSDLAATEYEYDLAVLQFQADTTYPTAKIGSSLYLEVGEPIFAAGFPYAQSVTKTSTSAPGLAFKQGRVSIILNQALEEGYQIGYTNDVKKGMSGGPLLNSRGEVVGVNGKHAYPLWESPELYQDGSQPCSALQDLITRSSLAIPIEKSIELAPQLESFRPPSDVELISKSNLLSENPELVAKMQAEADATTRSCENSVEESIGVSQGDQSIDN